MGAACRHEACPSVARAGAQAEAAEARRVARLHAVLNALPDVVAPGIAAELQREPQTVHAALVQFTAQLERDIGPLLSRTDGFSTD